MVKHFYSNTALSPVTEKVMLWTEDNLLPIALTGDHEALTTLLFILSSAVEQGQVLTPKLRNYLAMALRKGAGGIAWDDVFQVVRKPGQRDTRIANSNAQTFALLVEARRRERGETAEAAIAEVAKANFASESTVKQGWQKYKKYVGYVGNADDGILMLNTIELAPKRGVVKAKK